MTPDQFAALAELLRLRGGPATEGARLVLVEGIGVVRAAEQVGCSRQSVGNAVKRCQDGMALVRRAARV